MWCHKRSQVSESLQWTKVYILLNSPCILLYDKSPGDVTIKSPITIALWWITIWCHDEVNWWLSGDSQLETIEKPSWPLLCDNAPRNLTVMLFFMSSQRNCHGHFTVETPNHGHTKIIMWFQYNITWRLDRKQQW